MSRNQDSEGSDGLSVKLDRMSQLLTQTSTKLDGTNQRLDDFGDRMDRSDKQRELDRHETSSLREQLAGVAAACRFHVERTASAEEAAVAAAKEAAIAKEKAIAVESSWNDMRRHMEHRPGSAEYQKVGAALEQRQRTKDEEAAELEHRVVTAAAAAVTQALAIRDEAKKKAQEEQAEIARQVQAEQERQEAAELRRVQNRQKFITWAVRLGAATLITLGSSGMFTLWRQAKSNQEVTSRTLEVARRLHVQEELLRTVVRPDASVSIPTK